jgi:DNA polymerase-1
VQPRPIVLDSETDPIEQRPAYPPRPVGFSIKRPGDRRSTYHAWGHPVGNNTTFKQAQRVLRDAFCSGQPLLFHNGKFDVDVFETHMGMPRLPWHMYHDTLFLLFLYNPRALSISLKPASEVLLGMPPDERDAVRDWLIEQRIMKKQQKEIGKYISKAPGDIVGTYADGDVTRTEKLFKFLYPEIVKRGMQPAYDRERRLMPILLENERRGVNIDVRLLGKDIVAYQRAMETADNWLRKRLGVPDLNIDSDRDLADALEEAGAVSEWVLTPSGQKSVAKKNLTPEQFADARVARVLGYRNRLATCLGTFMLPWQAMAEATGRIYTNWNQVRQGHGNDGFVGARTGRLSSSPNFQNIPKDFYDKDDGYEHPRHLKSLPELPLLRRYVLPDKGDLLLHRDYNQQELRILAHFEDGALLDAYQKDPRLDVHTFVKGLIDGMVNRDVPRRAVKILNFGLIYGMGVGKLADGMRVPVDEASALKKAQKKALPGLKTLDESIRERVKAGEPIHTWGGREYYCEEPVLIDGRTQSFEYKLLNDLIQGSAADCTKEAIINYHEAPKRQANFLITVHDENNATSPKGRYRDEMKIMRTAMEDVEFSVPMLSDGKYGSRWSELKPYKE